MNNWMFTTMCACTHVRHAGSSLGVLGDDPQGTLFSLGACYTRGCGVVCGTSRHFWHQLIETTGAKAQEHFLMFLF